MSASIKTISAYVRFLLQTDRSAHDKSMTTIPKMVANVD